MDGGWCRVDGDVFVRRVGWMDGWRELLALTRADTRARESKQAEAELALERAALGLLRPALLAGGRHE